MPMGSFVSLLSTIVVGLGGLLTFLLVLYWLATFLPGKWRERGHVVVFVGPALFFVFIGLFIPALRTIYTSTLSNEGKPKFAGLTQYKYIFTTDATRLTLFNTMAWVLAGTLFTTVVALAIARYADGMRGEKAAKSLIFIPGAISLAGAGIIWKFVYAGLPFKVGLLNQVGKALPIGSGSWARGEKNWLIDRNLAMVKPPSIAPGFNTFLLIVIFIWASTGFATVVLSAAIKGVPESLVEAAKVDGATTRQAFYKVTLPYIRSTVITVATVTTIGALKAFDIVFSTTGGNFGTSTIANDFYRIYFVQDREGLGSALAVLLFLLVIPVTVINRRAQRRAEEMMHS
jgi:alpha-glucoside transport system permease protein